MLYIYQIIANINLSSRKINMKRRKLQAEFDFYLGSEQKDGIITRLAT